MDAETGRKLITNHSSNSRNKRLSNDEKTGLKNHDSVINYKNEYFIFIFSFTFIFIFIVIYIYSIAFISFFNIFFFLNSIKKLIF